MENEFWENAFNEKKCGDLNLLYSIILAKRLVGRSIKILTPTPDNGIITTLFT
jgi:hypothetical protein